MDDLTFRMINEYMVGNYKHTLPFGVPVVTLNNIHHEVHLRDYELSNGERIEVLALGKMTLNNTMDGYVEQCCYTENQVKQYFWITGK